MIWVIFTNLPMGRFHKKGTFGVAHMTKVARLKNKMEHLRARFAVFRPFFGRILTVLTVAIKVVIGFFIKSYENFIFVKRGLLMKYSVPPIITLHCDSISKGGNYLYRKDS